MKYSIVIPCFNEEKSINSLVNSCDHLLSRKNIEILFVDNGSTDHTYKTLKKSLKEKKNYQILKIDTNKGYGYGILTGLKHTKGDYIGWTHADLQTDPNDILKAISSIEKNGQNIFVKGLRYGRSFQDNFFTFGMSILETILFRKLLYDINAQPTMFSRDFYNSFSNPPLDFSLDLYVFYFAHIKKQKIIRFPTYFKKRKFGSSSWNFGFFSKIKFIKRTLQYSFKLKKNSNENSNS